jgi:hypothetical protein
MPYPLDLRIAGLAVLHAPPREAAEVLMPRSGEACEEDVSIEEHQAVLVVRAESVDTINDIPYMVVPTPDGAYVRFVLSGRLKLDTGKGGTPPLQSGDALNGYQHVLKTSRFTGVGALKHKDVLAPLLAARLEISGGSLSSGGNNPQRKFTLSNQQPFEIAEQIVLTDLVPGTTTLKSSENKVLVKFKDPIQGSLKLFVGNWPLEIPHDHSRYYSFHHLPWIKNLFEGGCGNADVPAKQLLATGVFCPPAQAP